MANATKIICPQCGFSQEVSADKLPGGPVIATCPQCGCRFRFSLQSGVGEILPPKGWRPLNSDTGRKPAQPPDNEDEEDIRVTAARAYQQEAERFSRELRDARNESAANPWDNAPGEDGWLGSFYQTAIRVMFAAQPFFARINPDAQKYRALVFYLIVCIFQTLVEKLWGSLLFAMLSPGAAGDPQMERLLSLLVADDNMALGLLLRCALLVLQIYFFSFLMFAVYRLMRPGIATYSLIFQIMAYSSAPSLLCVIPVLGSVAGLLWGLGCLLIGCKSALNLSWPQTLVGILPILMVIAPFLSSLGIITGQ